MRSHEFLRENEQFSHCRCYVHGITIRCYYCTVRRLMVCCCCAQTFGCACARMNMLRVNRTQSHRQCSLCMHAQHTARNFIVAASSTMLHTHIHTHSDDPYASVLHASTEKTVSVYAIFFSSFSSLLLRIVVIFGRSNPFPLLHVPIVHPSFRRNIQFAPVSRLCTTSIVRRYEFS